MAAERDIDPRIQRLKSTTFCGKRLTRRQIADIQLAMRVLEQLEQRGILTLPAKQGPGRGRQKPPKDVWLYPLRSDWREVLLGRPSAAQWH